MKKIVLLCAAGMSTSLLVQKIQKAAKEKGLEYNIAAFPIAEAGEHLKGTDIILLGPQVKYKLKEITNLANPIPVEVIDMVAYGMMDGEKIVNEILLKLE